MGLKIFRGSRFPARLKYKHPYPKQLPTALPVPQPSSVRARVPGALAVAFDCPWARVNVGWDILARRYARSLAEAGVDVRHYPTASALPAEVALEVARRGDAIDSADVHVWSTCFAPPQTLAGEVERHLMTRPRPRVFYTMFERTNASPQIAAYFNAKLDGVWVPCGANLRALQRAGCRKAVYIPVPYFDDDALLHLPRANEVVNFYWIGAWEARKAPENLIKAFMRAFKPGEARLLMKSATAQRGWPPAEVVIAHELSQNEVLVNGWSNANWGRSIEINRLVVSRADMIKNVHGRGDCYVSASRGEGVDMPAFEAKLAGRRVITTDSGGPLDFLGEGDILIPRTREVATHPSYGWETGATNGDYELDALIEAFRRARREPQTSRGDWPMATFHSRNVGETLKRWLGELR